MSDNKPSNTISNYKGKYYQIELEKVRDNTISDLYDQKTNRKTILVLKRKLGIFTDDVKSYYLDDNMIVIDDDTDEAIDDADTCLNDDNNQISDSCRPPPVKRQNSKDLLVANVNVYVNEDGSISPKLDKIELNLDDNSRLNASICSNSSSTLNEALNLLHGCISGKRKFCTNDIKMLNQKQILDLDNDLLVYICDFCHCLMRLKENMEKHLVESKHFSASVYCYDIHHHHSSSTANNGNDSINGATASSSATGIDHDAVHCNKIKYLKSRFALKNTQIIGTPTTTPPPPTTEGGTDNNNDLISVFCPLCFFPFGTHIGACLIHYKYAHRQNDSIYSLSSPSKHVYFEITKSHKCIECNLKCRKLTDLIHHLKQTKHKPFNESNTSQICVFCCTIDSCLYQTVDYSSFKIHILTHPAMHPNNIPPLLPPLTSSSTDDGLVDDPVVEFKMVIYKKPDCYYHIPKFDPQNLFDREEELRAINNLLELLKGHVDHEYVKKVRARKDELYKLSTRIIP